MRMRSPYDWPEPADGAIRLECACTALEARPRGWILLNAPSRAPANARHEGSAGRQFSTGGRSGERFCRRAPTVFAARPASARASGKIGRGGVDLSALDAMLRVDGARAGAGGRGEVCVIYTAPPAHRPPSSLFVDPALPLWQSAARSSTLTRRSRSPSEPLPLLRTRCRCLLA